MMIALKTLKCRQQLLLWGFLLLPAVVKAQPFARVCEIAEMAPVFTVARENESSEYIFVSVDASGTYPVSNNNLRRHLTTSGEAITVRHLLQDDDDNTTTTAPIDDVLLVRSCPCEPQSYCHISFDACGIPVALSEPAGCFVQSNRKTLIRNAWPLLLLWYSTMLFFLLCTEKGRNARSFIWLKCCNSHYNEQVVDRFLFAHGFSSHNPFETNPDNPSQHPLDWLPIARPVEPREPTELVLKTTIFQGPTTAGGQSSNNETADTSTVTGENTTENDNNNNNNHNNNNQDNAAVEEDYDACCTICFAPLEVGDRVGKLSCNHTFHVDCLREWLPRRNVCPLCQASDAAEPRYAEEENDGDINSDAANDANAPSPPEGDVELAPVEIPEEQEQRPRARRSMRPASYSFAQQLLSVSRI